MLSEQGERSFEDRRRTSRPGCRELGGVMFGLGDAFGVSELRLVDGRLETGRLSPGPHVLMSRSGVVAMLDASLGVSEGEQLGLDGTRLVGRRPNG